MADSKAEDTNAARGDRPSTEPSDQPDRPSAAPKIGDSRPAPVPENDNTAKSGDSSARKRRRRRGGRGRGGAQGDQGQQKGQGAQSQQKGQGGQVKNRPQSQRAQQGKNRQQGEGKRNGGGNRGGRARKAPTPIEAITTGEAVELDEKTLKSRRGRTRNGKAVGRYLMAVSVGESATQIAVLEGRKLVEHYVSLPSDDVSQIHGNIYLGRVQNVLPGMEAAFIDIATPKNAVLYRGDVHYDPDDVDGGRKEQPRIEQILKAKQSILCQVTKNPIAHKGARLTQEVSLPGRFVVLVPNSTTYGISKRLPDKERRRLRQILDKAKPANHGVIVRTAAENVTAQEIEHDVARLVAEWDEIEALAKRTKAPALLYREPEAAVRVIREEFNKDYRGVVIDDSDLFEEIRDYVASITPALADRVEYHDAEEGRLSLYERHHIEEQLRKALDRKVWLPSGGSLIIETTEALTVIDVNTGKNVGKSSLEETVFRNNLEAAEEVAHQLRLRDIGGIIVIDFVDMEIAKNRDQVIKTFRAALARDKTRTQVFDISDLGLVEMTRKRIGQGLLETVSDICPTCSGTGHVILEELIG